MKTTLIATALIVGFTATANAAGIGKPCTSEPQEKWQPIEAIEKLLNEGGYKVAKSKVKNACYEVYARDAKGARVELFVDPVTGSIVETLN